MQPLSSYSFADPKVMQDPYPYYERLRAEDPVHFDPGVHTWLVTRHEDIVAVARNTEVYSDEMRVSKSIRSPFQAEVEQYMQREGFMVLDPADSFKLDGELHTRRRKMVSHAFNGPAATAMEARVAAICRERAEAFLGRAEADLMREYAMPIPILEICDALGLPMDYVDEIGRGADSMVAQIGAGATRAVATSTLTMSCSCIASFARRSTSGASSRVMISSRRSCMRWRRGRSCRASPARKPCWAARRSRQGPS